MMLCTPDWSPELFDEIGLNEESVADLGPALADYLNTFSHCYSRSDQQENGETYIKGLLCDLDRKSIEPIALRYRDEKAVRTMQLFLKDAPWDEQQMKQLYQRRVCMLANNPNGMITIDGSDFAKKGSKSAGVHRQYCGVKGKSKTAKRAYLLVTPGRVVTVCWIPDSTFPRYGLTRSISLFGLNATSPKRPSFVRNHSWHST